MISKLQALIIAAVALTAAGAVILMDQDGYQNNALQQSNESDFNDGTFYYKITSETDKTVSVVAPDSGKYESQKALVVPDEVKKDSVTYKVTQIADEAFKGTSMLNAIDLTQATHLVSIGEEAFSGSNIYCDVVLPASVTTLGENCFFKATLTGFDAHLTSITTIPKQAFSNCSMMTKITLPATVTKFDAQAFQGCSKVSTINLDALTGDVTLGSDCFQSSFTGIDLALPKNVTDIQGDAFSGAKVTNFVLTTLGEHSIIKVDSGSILSKDGTKFIAYPISNPQLTFTVPAGVTELDTDAFYSAGNLKSLTIDNFVKCPEYSICNVSFENLTITATAASAGDYKGLIQTGFCNDDGYWKIAYNSSIKHLTIDTVQALDLTGMKQKDPLQRVDFTAQTTRTIGGDFQGADQRAGNRFSSAATTEVSSTFNFDDTRIVVLSADPSSGGSVSGDGKFKMNTSVTVTATANNGYKFDCWKDEAGNEKSKNASYQFTIEAEDVTLTAYFLPYQNTKITIPSDAGLNLVVAEKLAGPPENQKPSSYNYYTFRTVQPDSAVTNNDGTKTVIYSLYPKSGQTHTAYDITVTGTLGGKDVVLYRILFSKNTGIQEFTITQDQLTPEGKSSDTIDRTVKRDGGDDVGGMLVSGNKQNSVYIKNGETLEIMTYREWQAVGKDTMNNPFIDPELVWTITKLDGSAVADTELKFEKYDTSVGNQVTGKFTAGAVGTYVVRFYQQAFTMNYGGTGADWFYGATWPELTEVLVVNVNDTGEAPAFNTGMTIYDQVQKKDRQIDCEVDIFYYIQGKENGYSFTFTPDASVNSVKVYNPVISDYNKPGMTLSAAVNGTKNSDGSWTVLLKEGRNVVEISAGTNTIYQVLTSMSVKVTVNGTDIADSSACFKKGQDNTVVFLNPHNDSVGGIFNSKGKLAGLYNSGATIYYEYQDTGERVQTAKQPGYGYYFFLTQMQYQTLTVTVPESAAMGSDFTILGKGVHLSGFDGTAGDHRTWFHMNGYPLGVDRISGLPDISLKVQAAYGARLSVDGGQTWDNYDTFAQAMEKAADGNIIELGSAQDAAKIDKAVEVRLDGFVLKTAADKPLVIAANVTFKGASSVEAPVYMQFENGAFLTTDRNFFVTQMFGDVTAWVGKTFAAGLNVHEVSVKAAGYAQCLAADGNIAICHVTDMPFGIWNPDKMEFVFFESIEEALATGVDHVFMLSYVPVYDGGTPVYQYTVEEIISSDMTFDTVYRVTDGTVSTFYVNGNKYYSNGAYDVPLPQNVNFVTVSGDLYVEAGVTFTVGGIKVLADVILEGGYDGKDYNALATVWLSNQISDYKIHIGFENIDHWYTEVKTDTGHMYKLNDNCHYQFIQSSTSLVDRVAVIHSGFKAALGDDPRTATLACSQEMVAYTYINGSPVGYSDLNKAIEQAKKQGQDTVYFTYYTNTQDPSANILVQEITWDIDYDTLGLKLQTIHQASDGTSSKYDVDGSRATLKFSEGRSLSTSRDIDLSNVFIDGTLVMKSKSVATFAPKNANLGADPVVTIDLTGHETGLVAKNISGVTYKTILPSGSEGKAYEVVVKDDCLYLQLQKESKGSNVWIIVIAIIAILAVAGVALYVMKTKNMF